MSLIKIQTILKNHFNYAIDLLYHERNKTETIFFVIKRRFDSEIKSYDDYSMKTKELLYPVLACNCHRMCLISLVLIMISRKPYDDDLYQVVIKSTHSVGIFKN